MKKVLLLFLLVSACYAADENKYSITDFRGGLNTKTDPILLNINQSPSCQNVLFDETNALIKSSGFTFWDEIPSTGTILGGCEYPRVSGEKWFIVQVSSEIWGTKDNGATWILIKSGLKTINPVSYATCQDVVFMTNGFDDVFTFNGSTTTVYTYIPKSKYVTNHFGVLFMANTPDNQSAVYFNEALYGPQTPYGWKASNAFNIGQDDGDKITGIYSHKNNVIVMKTDSVFGILGYGGNMELIKYTNSYGSVSNGSVKEFKSNLIFLSKKGLCSFNDGNIQQIDKPIDNLTINANVSIGSLKAKRWTVTDPADFAQGTSSNVTTILEPGSIIMVPADNKTYHAANFSPNSYFIAVPQRGDGSAKGNLVYSLIDFPSYVDGYFIRNVSVKIAKVAGTINSSTSLELRMYDFYNNWREIAISTQTVDLGNAGWKTFFSSFTFSIQNMKTVAVGVWISTVAPNNAFEIEIIKNGGTVTQITDIEYNLKYSTYGYYISQKYNAGSSIYAWQHFSASQGLNSQYITYKIRGATSSANLDMYGDTGGWKNINNGDLIPLLTSQMWVQWRADISTAKETEIIYAVDLNWLEGSADYQGVTSAIYNNRYIIAYSTYGTTNNLVNVLDDNGAYNVWQGINPAVFINYDNNLYFVNYTGNAIYKMFQGRNYNGTAINGFWESPYLDFGSCDIDKKITKIGITAKGSGTLTIGYKSNYDTDYTTYTETLTTNIDNYLRNLPDMTAQKYWQIKVSNNGVGEWFEIPRITCYYDLEDLRPR